MKVYKPTEAQRRASFALSMLERYKKGEIMKWKNEDVSFYGLSEWSVARLKIYEAFGCGYIDWNMLNLALDKIETASNGSLMFE